MKKSVIFVFCLFLLLPAVNYAQLWTWMHGTDTVNRNAMYGTLGVSAPSIRPGSLSGSACWTDATGNFWMFAGELNNNGSINFVNDLWTYNTTNNEWKWVKGTGTVCVANYGTINVSNASNNPGGRRNSLTWTDASGNLWLFGGWGVATSTAQGYLNDLWKYNISTNQWTWVSGSNQTDQLGIYGTLGVPTSTDMPGGRASANGWIVGNLLYVFGGSGCSSSATNGYLSDLWTYNISNGQWNWLKGANYTYQAANHGTQGTTALSNTPGSRSGAVSWKDNSGSFWISGGYGFWSGFGTCSWGDLWRYDPGTNNWTWMKGSNNPYTSPLYGTQGAMNGANDPGTREAASGWTDNNGDLWLFGGNSYFSSNSEPCSDLWKYSVSLNQWVWMLGPNASFMPGVYGSRYLPASSNNPSYRSNAGSFKDNNGGLWLYCGSAVNTSVTPSVRYYADLWRLTTCSTQPSAPGGVSAINPTVCIGGTLSFTSAVSSNPIYWYTVVANTVFATGASASLTPATGVYSVYARTANSCTVSPPSAVAVVTVFARPVISVANATVCAGKIYTLNPTGAYVYTYTGGSQTIIPQSNSSYTINGASQQGCPATNTVVCTLSVMPSPTVVVNSGTICAGTGFTFTPSGANIYTFSTGSPLVYPTAPVNIYTVTGGISNGCTSPALSTVIVNPLPNLSAPSGTICRGQTFSISVSGAVTYTYSSGTQLVAPQTTTSYSVTGTTSLGCKSTSATVVVVSVYATPSINIAGPSNIICTGETHSFTASGASSYLWFNGLNLPVLNISFAVGNPTISVTGTDQNGCAATKSISLLVNECLGINDIQSSAFTDIYPNPTSGKLFVNVSEDVACTVMDVAGRVLFNTYIRQGGGEIDLSLLSPGIYTVNVFTAGRLVTKKIVRAE